MSMRMPALMRRALADIPTIEARKSPVTVGANCDAQPLTDVIAGFVAARVSE